MIRVAVARPRGRGLWCYHHLVRQEVASGAEEVLPVLARVEAAVEEEGLHAVGFVAYEAAAAMDPALPRPESGPWPLAWFGLFTPSPVPVEVTDPGPLPPVIWEPEMEPAAYRQALMRIRELLAAGETYQVNLTYRFRARWEGEPWPLFCHLFLQQPSAHAVYLETPQWAVCSASPELFFRRAGRAILSRPMKGTAPRGRFWAEDVLQAETLRTSAKERAENVMIVDMVRHDLGRVCLPASVTVPRLTQVERYPTVWQMTSLVAGRTEASLPQIFQALFPPASIIGAPKIRTAQIIQELEPSPRGLYTGAIGWVRPGRRAEFNVAIRTVGIHRVRGQAEYGVGGGIVWDSVASAEWAETQLKARVLGPRPPAFALMETMRATPAGVPWWPWHRQRLAESAAYFGWQLPWSTIEAELAAQCRLLTALLVLRVQLWPDGRRVWQTRPLPAPLRPYRVCFVPGFVDESDPLCCHKTSCRQRLEAARQRALAQGADDAVLINRRGQVTETTLANLLVLERGKWRTPARTCGLVPGVGRARLLARGRVEEAELTPADLLRAERILLINAVRGAWPAVLVG